MLRRESSNLSISTNSLGGEFSCKHLQQRTGYDFELTPQTIRIMYRRLMMAGYNHVEATNLIAHLMGLGPAKNGWSTKELQHLLFVKQMENNTSP